jgi:hypothetical protein
MSAPPAASHTIKARLSAIPGNLVAGDRVWLQLMGEHTCFYQNEDFGMSTTTKPVNQKAWFLILPVLLCVAFSAILPLMTVVNYSVQDIISPERRVFVGTEWFAAVMRDEELHSALLRQIIFSFWRCWRWNCRWVFCWPVDAGAGLEVLGGAGDRLAVAADPLERGGHHLADFWPRRHWPDGGCPAAAWALTTATPATPPTRG